VERLEQYRRRRLAARLRDVRLELELALDPALHRATVPDAISAKILSAGRTIESAAAELERAARRTSKRAQESDAG